MERTCHPRACMGPRPGHITYMNDHHASNASHQLEMLARVATQHWTISILTADHHPLHFLPPNDPNVRGRAEHEPPNKALLKILRIRRIVHAFVSKHAGRVAMALGGARAMLLDLLSKKQAAGVEMRRKTKGKQRGETNNKDPPCGCVELHLNLLPPSWSWSSSSSSKTTAVLESLEPGLLHYSYYESSWNTEIPPELQPPPIAGYLEWPDEEYGIMEEDGEGYHEIDGLAERFIARCHERFMLEKQESYRRYQEMLARTMQLTEMT